MEPPQEFKIIIPLKIQNIIKQKHLDIEQVISDAIQSIVQESPVLESYQEIPFPSEGLESLKTMDIPCGSYMQIPNLSDEQYEQLVNEESWEYLDSLLIHRCPESNYHDALVLFFVHRAKNLLDSHQYLIRASRIALAINEDKPEPDVMIFDRDSFQCRLRADMTQSEIVEAAPLIVIEVVSGISIEIDDEKTKKYLHKGVKEYWQVFTQEFPLTVTVNELKQGKYEARKYSTGEIRSKVIPSFSVQFEELAEPDNF